MASTFKPIGPNDVISSRTLLHEAIPITGTIVSGTYGEWPSDDNIKNYSHGMFQSVYDYPYLSSSANHIFDITLGVAPDTSLSVTQDLDKKTNIYNQMAQILVGYDITGSILQFDEDGDMSSGTKIKEALFLSFARLLVKDEVKKGTFSMKIAVAADFDDTRAKTLTITDYKADTSFKVNSPAGEYGVLWASGDINSSHPAKIQMDSVDFVPCGLLYYQAGIAVLTSSLFQMASNNGISDEASASDLDGDGSSMVTMFQSKSISGSAAALRHRIDNLAFNNTTELNSTIYFCRANHNEFNFSSNPTYLKNSQITVKSAATDTPVSYITTVGLYSADNQLLAVGKLSEPLRKDPSIEYILRARLDY